MFRARLINDNNSELAINTRYRTYLKNVNDWIHTLIRNMENKVLGGGHVILLLHSHDQPMLVYPEYHNLLPFRAKIRNGEIRNKIIFGEHYLKEYLNYVKHVNYVLEHCLPGGLTLTYDSTMVDNSDQLLGVEYAYMYENQLGHLTLLPSAVASGDGESITKIVSNFKKNTYEPPPTWIENIQIAKMNEIVKEIERLQTETNTINVTIKKLESKKIFLANIMICCIQPVHNSKNP